MMKSHDQVKFIGSSIKALAFRKPQKLKENEFQNKVEEASTILWTLHHSHKVTLSSRGDSETNVKRLRFKLSKHEFQIADL